MKKRLVSLILILVMIVSLMPTIALAANTDFAGGSGTEDDPYLIETKYHLDNVRNHLDAHFKMIADIEFTDADFAEGGDFYNNGQGWVPIGENSISAFTGVFDGNSKNITGVKITPEVSKTTFIGLFGFCQNADIRKINIIKCVVDVMVLDDASIYAGMLCGKFEESSLFHSTTSGDIKVSTAAVSDASYGHREIGAGGIIGYAEESTIKYCSNSSKVSTYSHNYAISGGIVGQNIVAYDPSYKTGGITNCSNYGTITASTVAGFNQPSAKAGGIVGDGYYGFVENSYNIGSISALSDAPLNRTIVGGIIGSGHETKVNLCYSIGSILASGSNTSNTFIGGIAGSHSFGTISNCYYTSTNNITSVGKSSSTVLGENVKRCSDNEIGQQSTFVEFDFENIWEFKEENSYLYPTLKNNEYIEYDYKFTTDDTITIQFSDSKEFELVVSDETIVEITELKTNKVQFGSSTEMSATAKLKPLKPGYVLVTAVDTTGKVLAKSILYIVEGEHQLVLSSVTKEATCTEAGEELYICKFCGYQEKKEVSILEHTYDNACDTSCDCGYEREITHDYQPTFDTENHFNKCTVCDDVINTKAHEFNNACDTDCDCGYTRTITHDYKVTYNAAGHFEECTVCGSIGDGAPHEFENACDKTCDCGYVRTVGDHIYDNDFDAKCNVCGEDRTAPNTPTKTFTDVKSGDWFKPFVDYAVAYNMFKGTGDTTFSPNTEMTRAQFVQVLANLSGVVLDNNVSSGFTDVPSGQWYTGAVKWAVDNGVASGVGNGKFDPNAKVTREQMCVMLVNYIEKYLGMNLEITTASTFADDKNISSWANVAVYKCFSAGLVSGTGNNNFSPKAIANRAQGATIFTNFHKAYMA